MTVKNGVRICKVCGMEYPYCKTEALKSTFRYQDVACCPEHAQIYFASIAESRKKSCDSLTSTPLNLHNEDDDEDFFEDEDEDEEDD